MIVWLSMPWPGASDGSTLGFIAGTAARITMTAGGVWLGGSMTGGHGQFLSAFLGATVGSVVGLGLIPVLPTIGAVIGYEVTDHKSGSKSSSPLETAVEPMIFNLLTLPL